MRDKLSIVVTAYGHGQTLDNVVFSLVDDVTTNNYWENNNNDLSNAKAYCGAINRLELKDDAWVRASVVRPNAFYSVSELLPPGFDTQMQDILLRAADGAVQKILREVDSRDLVAALCDASKPLLEKLFRNMTKRSAQTLRQEIEFFGKIPFEEAKQARRKIVDIIRRLEYTGEIVLKSTEDELVL